MSLGDSQLERYARQVIIPGVGVAGQERLLAGRVLILGEERERDITAEYLTRAGVTISLSPSERVDCVIGCRVESIDSGDLVAAAKTGAPLLWYSLSGRTLTAGVLSPYDGHRPIERVERTDHHDGACLGALAACDAAATALSVLLGWSGASSARWETIFV